MSQQDNFENIISDDIFYQLGLKINWKGEFYEQAKTKKITIIHQEITEETTTNDHF